MSKNNTNQGDEQNENQPVEPVQPDEGQDRPDVQVEGQDAPEQREVANNGDVSDPGNSGAFDLNGEVSGQADKPNG